MKTIRFLPLLAAGALATLTIAPARAVELQQKWQAGQTLDYDVSMNGTANLKVPTDAPVFFAGVPLEVDVNGKGTARLNTLEVDAAGAGTVYLEVPEFDLNGKAFGQKALIELRDGQTRFLLNGKPLGLPKPDAKNPPKRYGLIIAKDGRVKGVKELDQNGKLTATTQTKPQLSRIADDGKTVTPEEAVDKGAFITSLVLSALPTLWPQSDVQPGDTWKTTLPFPTAFARDAATAKGAAPLSEWTMTLKGQEVVDGLLLWRVGIVGGIQVDGANLAKPATPKKGEKPAPALDNLSQRVDGDLWFDAAAGKVVRGDMVIDARGQSHTVDTAGRRSDPSWADFTGTLGLRLQQ